MNVRAQVQAAVGELQKDEEALLAHLETERPEPIGSEAPEAQRRHCRSAFLVALLKALASEPARAAAYLPNIQLSGGLDVTGLTLETALFLPGLIATGPVCFDRGAFRYLDLSRARLAALSARGLLVAGDLVLHRARISHSFDLAGARIEGNLDLRSAILTIPDEGEAAPEIAGATAQTDRGETRRELYNRFEMGSLLDGRVGGSLRLCDARLDRKFRMTNARVGGDLDLWGVEFQDVGKLESGLICTNCEIGEKLVLSQARCDDNTRIALDYSRMRILQFGRDQKDWPHPGKISLEGTTFDALLFVQRQKAGAALNVFDQELTIDLLKRNGPAFYRQPWRQAAHSMRQKGHGEEALEILVVMEREAKRVEAEQYVERLRAKDLKAGERGYLRFRRLRGRVTDALWWFTDYGHRPEKVFWALVILLALNVSINCGIKWGDQTAIVPALEEVYASGEYNPWAGSPKEYPSFNPFIYALDTLLPMLDLGQERAWQPNWRHPIGIAYAFYLYWIHMFFGLLLIGTFVAGVSKRLTDNR